MNQITETAKLSRFALVCASLALMIAGCATTASFRPDIDSMKTALGEAKAAGAERLAPEEYAHAEACLDWLTHEATEFNPFADPNTRKYVDKCRTPLQALKSKMAAAREARVPAPPVPVQPVPAEPLAPEVDKGIYPAIGTLADALEALPQAEEAPIPAEEPAPLAEEAPPPSEVPAPPAVAATAEPVSPEPLAPEVDKGIYPAIGTLADALEALPQAVEPAPLAEEAAPPTEEPAAKGEELPPPAPPAPPPAEVAPAPALVPPTPLVAPPPPVAAVKEPDKAKKSPLGDIFFDYDQSLIRPDAQKSLDENAQRLRANPKATFIIEGHCDERGTNEYNLALGQRRAKATQDYLAASGIDPNRSKIISYGKERPFVVGHDEDAWKWNRRAHFVLE